jgi:solute:Na+ symporter, SSS family
MELTFYDWIIIAAYFIISLGVGLFFCKRAGKNLTEYFLSGRSLPWWIAGTSMVATTFAADTPLAVTGLVAKYGLAGNWFWWAMALGGMFTVFVYARLWRRSEVLTDVELVEIRYGGKPAAFLRGFRSLYIAILVNSIIIGWVTGAMLKVLKFTVFANVKEMNSIHDWYIIGGLLAIVGLYSALSGLWGVAITDFLQFFLAMLGCIVLAFIAVAHVGGIDAMQSLVSKNFGGGDQAFRFLPDFSAANPWMPLNIFLIMLFVQWWASWYPGAEPGGGGYVVQRMASCKDEKHSLLATLWYQIAHYCVRPWPWLIISFVALAMYPDLRSMDDPGVGFPMLMKDLAPAGLRGLMLVTFFAAFMSTISTQMNWGASYLVSDFYRRFIKPDASDKRLTGVSRIASIFVLLIGGFAAVLMKNVSVDEAWKFLAALGAGTGAVFMLRWFWWRINAWTEITAMVASFFYFIVISKAGAISGMNTVQMLSSIAIIFTGAWLIMTLIPDVRMRKPFSLLYSMLAIIFFVIAIWGGRISNIAQEQVLAIVACLTVISWLLVTYMTKPEKMEVLTAFYKKIRPGGPGWKPVAKEAPGVKCDKNLGLSIIAALFAAAIVYLVLPGVGFIIFKKYSYALMCFAGAGVCGLFVAMLMNKIGWEEIAK